jgi:hypothetical protein
MRAHDGSRPIRRSGFVVDPVGETAAAAIVRDGGLHRKNAATAPRLCLHVVTRDALDLVLGAQDDAYPLVQG